MATCGRKDVAAHVADSPGYSPKAETQLQSNWKRILGNHCFHNQANSAHTCWERSTPGHPIPLRSPCSFWFDHFRKMKHSCRKRHQTKEINTKTCVSPHHVSCMYADRQDQQQIRVTELHSIYKWVVLCSLSNKLPNIPSLGGCSSFLMSGVFSSTAVRQKPKIYNIQALCVETTHSTYFTTWHPLSFLSFLCHPYIFTIFLENFLFLLSVVFYASLLIDFSH